jgi:hypothetical protein
MRKTLSTAMLCFAGFALLSSSAWSVEIAGYESKSDSPKQIKVRLGPNEKAPEMLIVLDQSTGKGGYDIAIGDSNLDGSLAGETVVSDKANPGPDKCKNLEMKTQAPFAKLDPKAKYVLYLHSHAPQKGVSNFVLSTGVTVKTDDGDWMYRISHSQPKANAENVYPFALGKPVKVDIETKAAGNSQVSVSSSIKDADGQLVQAYQVKNSKPVAIAPHLKVASPDGRTIVDKGLSYG